MALIFAVVVAFYWFLFAGEEDDADDARTDFPAPQNGTSPNTACPQNEDAADGCVGRPDVGELSGRSMLIAPVGVTAGRAARWANRERWTMNRLIWLFVGVLAALCTLALVIVTIYVSRQCSDVASVQWKYTERTDCPRARIKVVDAQGHPIAGVDVGTDSNSGTTSSTTDSEGVAVLDLGEPDISAVYLRGVKLVEWPSWWPLDALAGVEFTITVKDMHAPASVSILLDRRQVETRGRAFGRMVALALVVPGVKLSQAVGYRNPRSRRLP